MAVSRTIVNFFLDLALLLVLTGLLGIAAILQFVFPQGTSAAGWKLWGYSYDAWSRLQFVLLCLLTVAILVHVMLHWTWVCSVLVCKLARRKDKSAQLDDGSRTLYGVATLIVLLIAISGALAWATLTIREPDHHFTKHAGQPAPLDGTAGTFKNPTPRATDISPIRTTHQAASRNR
jgi:hypothetical protein